MNEDLTDPFCSALAQVLLTMAQIEATIEPAKIKQQKQALGIVTGFIELNGPKHKGSLALSFSEPLIIAIYANMLGEQREKVDNEICDLVGELTNIVTGAAKPLLFKLGINLSLTRPVTLTGDPHDIEHSAEAPIIARQLICASGTATVEVCLKR